MSIKALVVDNNPVLLKAICAILEKAKCEVHSAKTGLEALEVLETFEPDIVFTDLVMPLISGEQLCRLLRSSKKHKDLFIVVISGILLEDRERILRDVDCDLCIAKGNLGEIRENLAEALEAFQSRQHTQSLTTALSPIIPKSIRPSEVAAELLAEKQHLAQILENIDEGIMELSEDGRVVGVNKAALKILSCGEEKLTGKEIDKINGWGDLSETVRLWKKKQLIGRGNKPLHILEDDPLELLERVVTVSFIPVVEQEKNFGLCILRDITRQYRAEKYSKELDEAVKVAKKMDALSCMAGGLAHDFNNLLTVICGNLDILSTYGSRQTATERNSMLEQTRKSAQVAVDLTRQISCFSNFGIVSREKKNFMDLIQEAVEKFFSRSPGKHELHFSGDDVRVNVDPEEIYHVIENVLQNAIEAAPDKKIIISAEQEVISSPQLMSGQFVPAGKYAKVAISDSGPGIDPEALVQVFDPYYSTKERGVHKGMGLGLTIVYATLRNHGGYVVIHSDHEKSGGTTVSMYLPVQDKLKGDVVEIHKIVKDKPAILLLDPDPQMREIGKVMLSHLGFQVLEVQGRKEALEEIEQICERNYEKLVLAIIDVSDCNKESPIETSRLIREMTPSVKIVAMSGGRFEPILEKSQEHGFVNSISKPYTMDTLKHIILSALQE